MEAIGLGEICEVEVSYASLEVQVGNSDSPRQFDIDLRPTLITIVPIDKTLEIPGNLNSLLIQPIASNKPALLLLPPPSIAPQLLKPVDQIIMVRQIVVDQIATDVELFAGLEQGERGIFDGR